VRRFAQSHPSVGFIEVSLEDNKQAGAILEAQTGINASCLGWHNVNTKILVTSTG
jgi:hypothetical protein